LFPFLEKNDCSSCRLAALFCFDKLIISKRGKKKIDRVVVHIAKVAVG
jgi:Pyruvate/2-oxoacid:ferredoxin oxidoreductase delta subunit